MIINIENLKKLGEIISCEGGVLILYYYEDKMYLSSQLYDGSGIIFYKSERESLILFFQSKIKLIDLYKMSNDTFITRKFQKVTTVFIKGAFHDLIQFGDKYFNEIDEDLINSSFITKLFDDYLS
jgi:hypothetical protein